MRHINKIQSTKLNKQSVDGFDLLSIRLNYRIIISDILITFRKLVSYKKHLSYICYVL